MILLIVTHEKTRGNVDTIIWDKTCCGWFLDWSNNNLVFYLQNYKIEMGVSISKYLLPRVIGRTAKIQTSHYLAPAAAVATAQSYILKMNLDYI